MIKCSIYNGISFIKLQLREEKKIEINSTFGYIELVYYRSALYYVLYLSNWLLQWILMHENLFQAKSGFKP